eukprot:6203027-Pleurochrysis_carterae.AAC.2
MGLVLPATTLQAYVSALRRKQLYGRSRPGCKRVNGAPRLVAKAAPLWRDWVGCRGPKVLEPAPSSSLCHCCVRVLGVAENPHEAMMPWAGRWAASCDATPSPGTGPALSWLRVRAARRPAHPSSRQGKHSPKGMVGGMNFSLASLLGAIVRLKRMRARAGARTGHVPIDRY